MKPKIERMLRAVCAVRNSAEAELAARSAELRAAQARCDAKRSAVQAHPPRPESGSDLLAAARYRAACLDAAKAAQRAVAVAEARAVPVRRKLAQSLAQEKALIRLAERLATEHKRAAGARAETAARAHRPASPSASPAGSDPTT